MIRLEVKEYVKNVKNYFTSLKLENYVLNSLEWSQKNKRILTDAMLITIAGVAAAMKNVG